MHPSVHSVALPVFTEFLAEAKFRLLSRLTGNAALFAGRTLNLSIADAKQKSALNSDYYSSKSAFLLREGEEPSGFGGGDTRSNQLAFEVRLSLVCLSLQ